MTLTAEQLAELDAKQEAAQKHPAPYAVIPMCDGITPEARDYYAAVMRAAPQLIAMAKRTAEAERELMVVVAEVGNKYRVVRGELDDRIADLERRLADATVLIDEMLDTMPIEWDTNDWERRRSDLNAAPPAEPEKPE